MGIPVNSIKEGCCDSNLEVFNPMDGDALDRIGSTCDKIIECNERYYLIEEKSLLMGFFNLSLKEMGESLEEYKYSENGIIYLKIDEIIDKIHSLHSETKKRLLAENINNMLMTSPKKVSNTTDILVKQFDSNKTANMPIFYLYCKSGKSIDRVMSNYLSRNRKNIFIDCDKLKEKLEEECL